ncbi:hypothetical protein SUDANB70_05154 [Streptomyces sp. enrichment culture]
MDVLITAGGQSAPATARSALAPPGAPVLVEPPTYPGMPSVARAAGLRPVPVPVGPDGVRPDLLADAFRARPPRLRLPAVVPASRRRRARPRPARRGGTSSPSPPPSPAGHIRLCFAAVAGPEEITEGVRRLRTACERAATSPAAR